jgi:hypothetical protein
LEHLHDEVYNFIEVDRTVIIVLESEDDIKFRANKWRWLTPTLQRKSNSNVPPQQPRHKFSWDYEVVTLGQLLEKGKKERQRKRYELYEASDILYHPSGDRVFDEEILSQPSLSSSSGSSYSLEEVLSEDKIIAAMGTFSTGPILHISAPNVLHLTELDWRDRRAEFRQPTTLNVLHHQDQERYQFIGNDSKSRSSSDSSESKSDDPTNNLELVYRMDLKLIQDDKDANNLIFHDGSSTIKSPGFANYSKDQSSKYSISGEQSISPLSLSSKINVQSKPFCKQYKN